MTAAPGHPNGRIVLHRGSCTRYLPDPPATVPRGDAPESTGCPGVAYGSKSRNRITARHEPPASGIMTRNEHPDRKEPELWLRRAKLEHMFASPVMAVEPSCS